jgi:hypothetical protein
MYCMAKGHSQEGGCRRVQEFAWKTKFSTAIVVKLTRVGS